MRSTLALYALLAVAAEAGPLRVPDARAAAIAEWVKRDGEPKSTTVTFVPGEALKETATGASFVVSESSTLKPTATEEPSTTSRGAGKLSSSTTSVVSVTGTPNTEIPTAVTDFPESTATVSPDVYKANLEMAKQYNAVFSTLTAQSACVKNQAACISSNTAVCSAGNSFILTPCPAGTSCFALPMNTTDGVELGCVDQATAEKVLGELPPAASASAPASASAAPAASSSKASGRFTKTVIATQTTGAVTLTLTFDPERPTATGGESSLSSITTRTLRFPTEVTTTATSSSSTRSPLDVIPVPDPTTTTITRTVFESTLPAAADPTGPPTTRTRTRTRRPPPPPPPQTTQEPDGIAADPSTVATAEPQPTRGPAGPNEDTRVTFTRVEKVTVTEKETVTVTAAGAAGQAAGVTATVTEKETATVTAVSTVLIVS